MVNAFEKAEFIRKAVETYETDLILSMRNAATTSVRGYRGMLCEDAWSNLADLRPCEPRAISMRSAGGSAEIRRCPI
jgi:hypothetical protein